MCGLAGAVSNYLSNHEIDTFKDLLVCASLRGQDSTGVIQIGWRKYADKKLASVSTKTLGTPFDYFEHSKFDEIKKELQSLKACIGHCRSATQGEIIVKNAHPFRFGGIVGVHNGTITAKFRNRKQFETDSETLFHNINQYGTKEALSEIQHKTNGSFAIVYYDSADQSINFIRNRERPLVIALAKHTDTLYYASTKAMLQCALDHNNIAIGSIYDLTPFGLLTINLDDSKPLSTTDFKPNYIKEYSGVSKSHTTYPSPAINLAPTPPYCHTPTTYPDNQNTPTPNNYGRVEDNTSKVPLTGEQVLSKIHHARGTGSVTSIEEGRRNSTSKALRKDGRYIGYQGEDFDRDEISKILNKGCAWCSNPKQITDPVRWTARNEFVCEECKDNEYFKEYMDCTRMEARG